MPISHLRTFLISICCIFGFSTNAQVNYERYHQQIIKAETLVATESYEEALTVYDQLFAEYEFVFLRDYKVAAQVAAYTQNIQLAFDYIGFGVTNGWTLSEIKKHDVLKPLKKAQQWADLEFNYEVLREDFTTRINEPIRRQVEQMYKKDQKLALKYYLKPGDQAKESLINDELIPHTEAQMGDLLEIMNLFGYPGEQLIGNSLWMWTIICHHNSISPDYQQYDDIYPKMKSKLLNAVRLGQMNPYDLAIIDEWYITVKSDSGEKSYGYINPLTSADELEKANELRNQLNLRPVELRNKLVELQEKTKINFYLAGETWVEGKILVQ